MRAIRAPLLRQPEIFLPAVPGSGMPADAAMGPGNEPWSPRLYEAEIRAARPVAASGPDTDVGLASGRERLRGASAPDPQMPRHTGLPALAVWRCGFRASEA